MLKGYRIHKSDLIVLGVFLGLGGVILLIMIDFLWGVLSMVGAFTCLYHAYLFDQKKPSPSETQVEADELSRLKKTG